MVTNPARLRCCCVATALASVVVAVALMLERLAVRPDLGRLQRQGDTASLGDLVTGVAAGGIAVSIAGLAVSLLLAAADVAMQERSGWLHQMSVIWCPGWSRRFVVALCGVGIALPVSAASSSADDHGHGDCGSACAIRMDGLPLPDLPTRQRPPGGRHPSSQVVVRPGDCLWTIAERELRRQAPDAAVARRVDAWYVANTATIGPDPDLIFPGSHLDRPEVSP